MAIDMSWTRTDETKFYWKFLFTNPYSRREPMYN